MSKFSSKLLKWWDKYGRKDMPWQQNPTAYKIWVSEVMLQQTQVATVIPYFQRFMQRFPTIKQLAQSHLDEVLFLWTGLGYYNRAKNLHKTARIVVEVYHSQLPADIQLLEKLPGIGSSTAGAIAAQAYHQRAAILDGNVKRVLSRVYCVEGQVGDSRVQKQLWKYAKQLTPVERVRDYTQAIMDLGATLCGRGLPQCEQCPVKSLCRAYQRGLQSQFPQPKPKKHYPIRYSGMLIVRFSNKILLRKNPPTGIWSNLYSFQQLQLTKPKIFRQEVKKELANMGIMDVNHIEIQSAMSHKFSHFQLNYFPVIIDIDKKPQRIEDDTLTLWYDLMTPQAVGLPQPVANLLKKCQALT